MTVLIAVLLANIEPLCKDIIYSLVDPMKIYNREELAKLLMSKMTLTLKSNKKYF